MNQETMQGLLLRRPFESIELRTYNGASQWVRHPECAAVMASHLFLVEPGTDRFEMIPYRSISSVASYQASASA
jgi:hypothetical protein